MKDPLTHSPSSKEMQAIDSSPEKNQNEANAGNQLNERETQKLDFFTNKERIHAKSGKITVGSDAMLTSEDYYRLIPKKESRSSKLFFIILPALLLSLAILSYFLFFSGSKKKTEIPEHVIIAGVSDIDQKNIQQAYKKALHFYTFKDYQQAKEIFLRVAQLGHPSAQYYTGYMYEIGLGGEVIDYTKAMEWYKKAAHQGEAQAQTNIGSLYRYGQGVNKDYKKAMDWYQKAATLNHAKAQTNIGHMYLMGQGVEMNYEYAKKYLKKAAAQGDNEAKEVLEKIGSN